MFSVFYYFHYKNHLNLLLDRQAGQTAINAHFAKDKIVDIFHNIHNDMQKNESKDLDKLYFVANQISQNKNYSLQSIKKEINANITNKTIDIFLINKDFVVFDTTYPPDMNLDFHNIPNTLKTMNEIYYGQRPFDISKPIFNFSIKDNTLLKKYFLIKPKELDFMVQIGIAYNSFDSKIMNTEIKKIIPNIVNYEMYAFFKTSTFQNTHIDTLIFSSDRLEFLKQGNSKNEYFKKHRDNHAPYPNFKKIYEEIVHQKYPNDHYLAYENMINVLQANKNVIILNNLNNSSTIVIPVNFYKNYLDKYMNEVVFFVLTIDNALLTQEINHFKMVNIGYLLLCLFIFILVGFIIHNKIFNPLANMQYLMNQRKKINQDLIDKSKNELGDVMLTYNELFDKLEKESFTNKTLLENLKTFASNSIHQLKHQ